jgi:hypothetical protein
MNNNNQDLQFLALILKLDNRVKVYSNPKLSDLAVVVVEDMSVAPTAVVESKFVVLLTVDYIAVLLKPDYKLFPVKMYICHGRISVLKSSLLNNLRILATVKAIPCLVVNRVTSYQGNKFLHNNAGLFGKMDLDFDP